MDRAHRLLEVGYFPSQLPPPFKTTDLANAYQALLSAWEKLPQPQGKGTSKTPKAPASKAELFSVARAGHQRRQTSLPNPVAQTFLATAVSNHWKDFVSHYRKSRLSVSRPRFQKKGARAANIPSMQRIYERKVARSAGYRFMLRTDISRFFPTIYTHSVPWALHGKASAKKNKNPTPKYFGNLIDLALRQAQDQQTIGIAIGPDTSHIIAEAISVSIDLELRKLLKYWPAGFRYVDDIYLFFSSHADAEDALAKIIKAMADYELQINYEKTTICKVIEISDDFWTHQIRSFRIAPKGARQSSDINHFFELAKHLAKTNSDESVMLYALKRAASTVIRKNNWANFEAHICHVALAYPNTLQLVARLLSTYHRLRYPLGTERLSRVINSIIEDHAPLGHHSEVAWCLWMCKELGLRLSESNIDEVTGMQSSVCALLLLDLDASGSLSRSPRNAQWRNLEDPSALHEDLWLLSYEAGLRAWGGLRDNHIKADPHFGLMRSAKVHFYDQSATLTPLFQVKESALRQHNLQDPFELFDLDDLDDIEDLVEYEEGDSGYEGVVVDDDISNQDDYVDMAADDDDEESDPFNELWDIPEKR